MMENKTNYAAEAGADAENTGRQRDVNPGGGPYTPPGYPAAAPRKVRRVGTFTLGVVLLTAGALLMIKILMPAFDLSIVLRFSPVLLILLGVEVLVYATRPDVTLKYDFLSIILCFLVICGTAVTGLAIRFAAYVDPERTRAAQQLKGELETSAYTVLQPQSGIIRDMSVNLWQDEVFPYDAAELTVEGLSENPAADAQLYVTFAGPYTSPEAFAADCKTVLAAARAAGLPFTEYRFDTWHGSEADASAPQFSLDAGNPWLLDAEADALLKNVNQSWPFDGDEYATAAERDAAMARATAESAAETA